MAQARRRAGTERQKRDRVLEGSPDASPFTSISVLVDTNVILDVVLERQPWADVATLLLEHSARGDVHGFVAGHTITTIFYIVRRERGRSVAMSAVGDLLTIVDVVELGRADFHRALALGLEDFEDAVQAAACLRVGARYLVTRNEKDYKKAPVTPRSPGEVLALLGSAGR